MAVPVSPLMTGKVEGPATEALSGNRGPKKTGASPVASGGGQTKEVGSPVSDFLKIIQDLFAGKGNPKKEAGESKLPVMQEKQVSVGEKKPLDSKTALLQTGTIKRNPLEKDVLVPPKIVAPGAEEGGIEVSSATTQKKARLPAPSDAVSDKEAQESKQKKAPVVEGDRAKKSSKELTDIPTGVLAGALLQNSLSTGTLGSKNKNSSVNGEGDTDAPGIAKAESKKKDKRTERLELEVYDLRTGANRQNASVNRPVSGKENKDGKEGDLVIKLHSPVSSDSPLSDKASPVPSSPLDFQNALARELRDSGNADIVKHASMVLKDGDQGVIRLSLQPESLGTVKIRLEMADDKIAGHIVVQTPEALRAFESEIRSLEQAFRDGGFGGASLDVSVSADGGGNQNGGQNPQESAEPFFSQRWAAKSYDGSAPSVYVPIASQDRTSNLMSINLLA